jgi:DNA repair protein RecN (Recombination protein N)
VAAMIEELRIRGIGVIADAHLDFSPGFTVITGETGAGKTMILSGIELLRGARAESGHLRDPEGSAEVDAVVSLESGDIAAVSSVLDELGVELDEEALIARRTVSGKGRSRAHLGQRPVPVSALADVWSPLVAVHGQADQARLRESAWQRTLVDRFGGEPLAKALDRYRVLWHEWRDVQAELAELRSSLADRERTATLLRLGIAEIDGVSPEPGEDDALDAEASVLAHAGGLRDAALAARGLVSGSGDDIDAGAVLALLARTGDHLEAMSSVDERLGQLANRIRAVATEIADIDAELGEYVRSVDADPSRQAWVEERRSRLATLRKSYGATIDEVLAWREDAVAQVAAVDGGADRLEELSAAEQRLAGSVREQASEVSALRVSAGEDLIARVEAELQDLAMPDARLSVEVIGDLDDLHAHGADTVNVLLAPHPGATPRPVGKGASGGELSRLALAFEVALAGDSPVPTMIFDEVDAGVGGSVAVEVGRRLSRLARGTQVIVVTHLPQVAAFADNHLVVSKDSDGSVTQASVHRVEGEERVSELVRMLSGLSGSQTGAAHAQELLEVARTERDIAAPRTSARAGDLAQ